MPRVIARAANAEEACSELVERLVAIPEIDFAALWVRPEVIGQKGSRFMLVGAMPGKVGAMAFIESSDPLAEWADASRAFSWRVSDPSYSAAMSDPFHGRGLYVLFTLGGDLLLKLHASDQLISAPEEIRGVQSALSELLAHLKHSAPAAIKAPPDPPQPELSSVIDLAFLEATAMGDTEFMQHIMQISIEEIEGALARLDTACQDSDGEGMVFIAHKLRSTARTVGADSFDEVLGKAETDASAASAEARSRMIADCQTEGARVLLALRRIT